MIKSIGGSQTVAVIKINTQSFLIEILCILSYKECITTIFSDYQHIFIVTSFAAIYRTVAAHWAGDCFLWKINGTYSLETWNHL
jgi:hypothetical protein